jgi:hypothetical protein
MNARISVQTRPLANSTPLSTSHSLSSALEVPSIVHEVLHTPGQPLDAGTRAVMELHFGHDFSQVRVHTGPQATESAQAMNAKAYTVGNELV